MRRSKKTSVVAIVQVRMGASRLPGKPLKEVLGRSLLSYQIERIRRSKLIDQIVIATTTEIRDQQIVDLCKKENIAVFRGSENDVLDRYYQAAKAVNADVIVRLTGDCPLIDPEIIDQVIKTYFDNYSTYDYVSNSLQRTYPRGLDVEVFSVQALERAIHEAHRPEEREHVTPYFYRHPELFSLGVVTQESNQSHHRWTVDTEEDFELISHLIEELYPQKPSFTSEDIYRQLILHPEWVAINAHIQQKPL